MSKLFSKLGLIYILLLSTLTSAEPPRKNIYCEPYEKANHKNKLYEKTNKYEIEKLRYEIKEYDSYGRLDIHYNQLPRSALKVDGGYITGSDRGEWSGELIFLREDKTFDYLVRDNIEDIYKMPFGIIAIGGLAHLTLDYGKIYHIEKNKNNKYEAKPFHGLPSAPYASWQFTNRDVFIKTRSGYFILNKKGELYGVNCN